MKIECDYCKSMVEVVGGPTRCPNCTAYMGNFLDASLITARKLDFSYLGAVAMAVKK